MKYIRINVNINIDDLYENNCKILDSLFRKARICRWVYYTPGKKLNFIEEYTQHKCIGLI